MHWHRIVLFVCLMGLILVSLNTVSAATYYVTHDAGVGGIGTFGYPWNITHAFTTATAGDIVEVQGGNYGSVHPVVGNNGTSGNLITFQADNGTPILDGTGNPNYYGIQITGKSYIKIDGFDINNYNYGIIIETTIGPPRIPSNNNTIINNTIHSNELDFAGGIGIYLVGSTTVDIENNNIINNTIYLNEWNGIHLTSASNNTLTSNIIYSNERHGIVIATSSNYNVLNNNNVSDTSGGYYDYALNSEFGTIEGNIIRNPFNSQNTIYTPDTESSIIIENTDGKVFNETSSKTTMGYSNGNFSMYLIGTIETITINQLDYTMGFTSTSNTIANPLKSGELANFTVVDGLTNWVNSTSSHLVNDMQYVLYNTSHIESQTAASGYVNFTINLIPGTYTIKKNTLPSVSNVTISPGAPVPIDNLTANNDTATDADGDTITLIYHWYKNGTIQPALTNSTWVYYDNTSTDEVWKVGIIPNDGFENGSEVFSATVTIGSGNTAPTLTSLTSNQSSKKYGYDIKFMTVGASDPDGDHYNLSVGTASGLDDVCNSSIVADGGVANCTFTINWTSGSQTFYGSIYDGIDTSIEYTTVITVDTTPPVFNSSSVNISSFQQGGSVLISAEIGLANGTITLPKVKIRNPRGVSTNYSMSGDGANGTYTYTFTPASAGSWFVTNIYASDDSGNTLDEVVSYGISVGTTGGAGGGGGGGGAPITIIELGNLSLSPDVRHTYFWYTAISGDQSARYKYVANRNITSCEVAPNDDATCEIVDGYVIYVTLIVNETVESYDGVLTIRDEYGYTADAKLIVGVIKLTGALPFFNIDVSLLPDGLIQLLETFFEIQDKVIVGIRTFLVGGIGLAFFGALFLAYRS